MSIATPETVVLLTNKIDCVPRQELSSFILHLFNDLLYLKHLENKIALSQDGGVPYFGLLPAGDRNTWWSNLRLYVYKEEEREQCHQTNLGLV